MHTVLVNRTGPINPDLTNGSPFHFLYCGWEFRAKLPADLAVSWATVFCRLSSCDREHHQRQHGRQRSDEAGYSAENFSKQLGHQFSHGFNPSTLMRCPHSGPGTCASRPPRRTPQRNLAGERVRKPFGVQPFGCPGLSTFLLRNDAIKARRELAGFQIHKIIIAGVPFLKRRPNGRPVRQVR